MSDIVLKGLLLCGRSFTASETAVKEDTQLVAAAGDVYAQQQCAIL